MLKLSNIKNREKYKMNDTYKVITLCGSTRFKKEFMNSQKKLTLAGNIVISVGLFGHSGDWEVWENMDEGTLTQTKRMLDDMHKRKIDMADAIFVVNKDGYIGESTKSEIAYAKTHGKEILYYEDPIVETQMEMYVKEIYDPTEKKAITELILANLSPWFGIEESKNAYIRDAIGYTFFACFQKETPVGFAALSPTSNDCLEIVVMGVLPKVHRKKCGTKLVQSAEMYARTKRYSYMQVKTVKRGKYPQYDITNAFYQSLGYKEMECFPTLWDIHNPCQVYIKYLL